MIQGVVSADREAILRLTVFGPSGQEREIDAVIHTGFDGSLTLPASLISELGLVWRGRGRAMLADGSESVFDIHEGIVAWDGRPRRIAVDATEMVPLVGMAMRDGHELTIEIRSLGRVLIRELP